MSAPSKFYYVILPEALKVCFVLAVTGSLMWWVATSIRAERNKLCLEMDGLTLNACLLRCQSSGTTQLPAECGDACTETSCVRWRK